MGIFCWAGFVILALLFFCHRPHMAPHVALQTDQTPRSRGGRPRLVSEEGRRGGPSRKGLRAAETSAKRVRSRKGASSRFFLTFFKE